jgi:RecJ OB domain
MYVQESERWFEAVGWGLASWAPHLARGQNAEVAFCLGENQFQGETSLRLILKDVRC